MKLLTSLTITIALVTPLLAQTPAPTPSVAEMQAKEELNEAVRAYREGKFREAQTHSERALLLDPQNKTAPYFVARTIHLQYKQQNDVSPRYGRPRTGSTYHDSNRSASVNFSIESND